MPEDNTIQALLDEQTAHAATQAALTATREENKHLRVDLEKATATIRASHEILSDEAQVSRNGSLVDRVRWLAANRTTTEAENQRLRAELAALQSRTAKAIAATLPTSPDLPPLAEGDVRDGVMSGAEADATERAEAAERKLARARRIVHRLVDLHIDDTGR